MMRLAAGRRATHLLHWGLQTHWIKCNSSARTPPQKFYSCIPEEPSATAADGEEDVFLRQQAKGINTIDAVGTGVERQECSHGGLLGLGSIAECKMSGKCFTKILAGRAPASNLFKVGMYGAYARLLAP